MFFWDFGGGGSGGGGILMRDKFTTHNKLETMALSIYDKLHCHCVSNHLLAVLTISNAVTIVCVNTNAFSINKLIKNINKLINKQTNK